MLLVTGEVERVIEREAGNPGNTWIEQTLVVRDWGQTLYVTAGRELSEKGLPAEGDKVALEVSVRTYISTKTNKPGHSYTAHRRNSETEKQLFGSPVRAAG